MTENVEATYVPGYNGMYMVTRDGRIWSWITRRFLKGRVQGRYLCVRLFRNLKTKEKPIHRLVALNFVPNPDKKPYVHHKDGNKFNNDADNLEWTTEQENTVYSWQAGTSKYVPSDIRRIATSRATRKLSFNQENQVKRLYHEEKITQVEIAKKYSVSRHTIMRIINNKHKVKAATYGI